MFLVYPTEYWFSNEHALQIVDDQDRLQYAAKDIYDCGQWLIDHGQTEFLAPRDGALHVNVLDLTGPPRKGAEWRYNGEEPGSNDVARAFLERFGRDRLDVITRYWSPMHSWVNFDTSPGDDPFQSVAGLH